jgi:hypothetical protein
MDEKSFIEWFPWGNPKAKEDNGKEKMNIQNFQNYSNSSPKTQARQLSGPIPYILNRKNSETENKLGTDRNLRANFCKFNFDLWL